MRIYCNLANEFAILKLIRKFGFSKNVAQCGFHYFDSDLFKISKFEFLFFFELPIK